MEYFDLTSQNLDDETLYIRVSNYVKIKWIMLLAIAGTVAFLAVFIESAQQNLVELAILMLGGVLFNGLIQFLNSYGKKKNAGFRWTATLGLLQLLFDVAFFSFFIYFGGGNMSQATILYVIPIMLSRIFFGRGIGLMTAVLAALGYSATTIIISSQNPGLVAIDDLVLRLAFYSTIFLVLAYLSDFIYAIRHKEDINRAQTEMISLASHQLRTPATAVQGFLSFLLDESLGKINKQQREFLQLAYKENEIELRLIENMLSVAKIDLKGLRFEPKIGDVAQPVYESVTENTSIINRRGQNIQLHRPKRTFYAKIDPQIFKMAIDNLISNASKYTKRGGSINVSVKGTPDRVEVSVEDNGAGIPRSEQPKLFQRFSRIASADSEGVTGAGLGLYIVKELVSLHDGSISVVSYPGEGSIFTISLPRVHGKRELEESDSKK